MIDDIRIDKSWMNCYPDETPIDDLFMTALEERAAELEITVDYYMEEFM
jgi:hypothetical protein